MAGSASYVVGTVPTVIAAAGRKLTSGPSGWFQAITGGTTVTFGGPNVTAGGPQTITTGGTFTSFLFPGDTVYAVGAGTAATVSVFQAGG